MGKIKLVLFIFLFLCSSIISQANERDFLYSDEYFDYLIECAQIEAQKQQEEASEEIVFEELKDENEITALEFSDEIEGSYEPFKLRIQETTNIGAYNETFIKEDTKTIIPVGEKFSFIQDTYKFRNKYNSDDYRVLAGAEFKPLKFFNIAGGLETNYRGFDQNPTSRKLYLTPTLYINDKLSLSFYNKMNVVTHSSDHDIGVNISPFKSKAVDFRVYAGLTKNPNAKTSQSINFYTNFYLF